MLVDIHELTGAQMSQNSNFFVEFNFLTYLIISKRRPDNVKIV